MKKRDPIIQADSISGQIAGEAMVEAVENQLRDNNPPETRHTLERLMVMGETRESAIRYIATALSVEVFEAMKNQTSYDEARYVMNLKGLPTLPGE